MPTVSAHVAITLAQHADQVFGVMGNGNAYFLDALERETEATFTSMRHEQGAVVAAALTWSPGPARGRELVSGARIGVLVAGALRSEPRIDADARGFCCVTSSRGSRGSQRIDRGGVRPGVVGRRSTQMNADCR